MLELITARATAEPEGAIRGTLDALAREGARRMIEAALQLEVEEYVSRHRSERDPAGHAVVVRNGTARPRSVTCCRTPKSAGIWTDDGDHDVGLARGALRVTSAARRR
jgi:O-acetyl-ADP-ribose deacetylase (regulator of RNase III)